MKKILSLVLCLGLFTALSAAAKTEKDAQYYYEQGQSYEKLNNKFGAIDVYSEAVKLNPDFDTAREARAKLYYFFEKYEEALNDFEYFYNKPNYGAAAFYDYRIECKKRLGKYDEAMDDMYEVILAYGGQAKLYQDMLDIAKDHPELQYKLKPEAHAALNAKYQTQAKALRDYARTFDNGQNVITNKEYAKFFMDIAQALDPETQNTEWDGTAQVGQSTYRIAPVTEGEIIDVDYQKK